ncbi:MAG: zinc ribbon domain-containing protein [Acidobacteria bacterium]|jgi:hypothetical protein|nr:zinc ribbon domain-containing protein [Acidobacteriota bacterium]
MFCPSCGLEDKQSNQFCRACGADLRGVRNALERPDAVTSSAISSRGEIGRAVAARIRQTASAHELKKVAEDVLPEIEKFLESPVEKRLRRVRAGVVTASAGLGATVLLFLISLQDKKAFFLPAVGLVVFFVGLGIILNGLLFTLPPKSIADNSFEADSQRELDAAAPQTGNLVLPPETSEVFTSVTEHTTRHLKEKQPIPRS